MSEVETPSKFSLFDLLTGICAVGPVASGLTIGSKVGFVGIATGIVLGLLFGVLSAFVFRQALRWIRERWLQLETTGNMQQAAFAVVVSVASIAWVIAANVVSVLSAAYVIKLVAG